MENKNFLNIPFILIILAALIFFSACTSSDGNGRSYPEKENHTANSNATERPDNSSGGQAPFVSINPVIWSHEDQILNITGTTSFPEGTGVTILAGLAVHPCPARPPGAKMETGGRRTLCNGNCSTEIVEYHLYAAQGPGGNSTWNCPVNTTGWCPLESYFICAKIKAGNETIQDAEGFRFSG